MAGHSHWAQIKHRKAVVDARRGKLFAKLIRAIEVAARDAGTSNPDQSMTLAAAVERARSYSVPADTIERAARRGAGELEGARYETVVYEGYAPNGVAVMVEALTDNRNRTGSEIRSLFARHGGSLGEPGSVAWMFTRKGVIALAGEHSEDEVLAAAAEAGAEDAVLQGERWEVTCDPRELARVRRALEEAGLRVESAELMLLPNATVRLDAEAARRVLRLLDALEDHDDVQSVATNFDIPDEVLAEVS